MPKTRNLYRNQWLSQEVLFSGLSVACSQQAQFSLHSPLPGYGWD